MTATRSASQRITDEVTSWPGVEAGPGRRGEFAFKLGAKEIGHLHGDHAAHFFFPKPLWTELTQQGRITEHPVFPGKVGPAARRIESEGDVREVIALMRLNYEQADARRAERIARQAERAASQAERGTSLPERAVGPAEGTPAGQATFSAAEVAYLTSQRRLARLATVGPDGTPHVVPVGFSYNAELQTIDVTGRDLPPTKKYRDVQSTGRAAIVVDDLASTEPWHPRAVEVRGRAEAITEPRPLIRIYPERVVSWGLESARSSASPRPRAWSS
jgi:pyridoxamine 5'-phosphate oxidase family protein